MPNQPWTVFDPEGFAAFRIAMMVMACCGLLSVYGFSRLFLSEEWAFFAFLVAATAPFTIHEIYFTWPKLEAASFVFLAAYLILRRYSFAGGLALGLGYLCHPCALLATPALAALIVLRDSAPIWPPRALLSEARHSTWSCVLLLAGLSIWVLVWRMVNGHHFSQQGFLSYFLWAANRTPPTFMYWLNYRLDSIWKTLVPLHTFFFHSTDRDANAVSGHSAPSVLFCLQYWTTVPFGAGIAYFFYLLRSVWLGWLHARAWLVFTVCIPFLVFVAYWGTADSGLLREGLHPWFLGLMVFSVCMLRKIDIRSRLIWKLVNIALLLRAADILLMLLFPTLSWQHSIVQRGFVVSDTTALLGMTAGVTGLCLYAFCYAEGLRKRTLGKLTDRPNPLKTQYLNDVGFVR